MNAEEYFIQLQQMQDFLEVTAGDDPAEMVARLSEINVMMARTGKMLADAKQMQEIAIAAVYEERGEFISRMPATVATKFIASQCNEINHLVNWIERINRSCVHAGDNIRTQISFAKEQMSLTRKGY